MNMNVKRHGSVVVKTVLCLHMAALLLATAFAGPVAAAKCVRFRGVISGIEDFNPKDDMSGLIIEGNGGGWAAHLGRITTAWKFDITFSNPDNLHPGIRTFVAANGDELWTEGMGSGTDPAADPNFNQYVVEELVITGGTGRFNGASGRIIVRRVVFDVRPGVNLKTLGRFNGYINLARRIRRK